MTNMTHSLSGVLIVLGLMSGCGLNDQEFALPPGDAQRGEAAFLELQCNHCHSVKDSVKRQREEGHPQIYVTLGGEKTRVKTYGELVTSIINPSHKLARGPDFRHVDEDGVSRMPVYNEVMTVQQLVDITTFLSSKYSVWAPEYRVVPHP